MAKIRNRKTIKNRRIRKNRNTKRKLSISKIRGKKKQIGGIPKIIL